MTTRHGFQPSLRPDRAIANLGDLATLGEWFDGDGAMRCGSTVEATRHDNTRRAGFAAIALLAYARTAGPWPPDGATDEQPNVVLADLLCDLRHLADALRLDYSQADDAGRSYYANEARGRWA